MEKKTDLRVEKTYLALRNAFTSLLEEKRFEDFTVNELCQRAMIRRTTFYKHFADKYEYFSFYTKEISSEFQKQLPSDAMSEDVNSYFLYMSRELLRFIAGHHRLVQNIASSNMFPVLLDGLSEQIMHELLIVFRKTEAMNHLSNVQLEGLAAFYAGGLLTVLRRWFERGEPMDEEQFIQIIFEFTKQKI